MTLQNLATRIKGRYWSKNGVERVYLECGYNTRKIKTTTYIYQDESGEFKVSCFIDCPSQNYNWIKSQRDQIIKDVEEKIQEIIGELEPA